MLPLVLLLIVIAPIVLAALVVDTVRAQRRMGGLPPFRSTYRAYGA